MAIVRQRLHREQLTDIQSAVRGVALNFDCQVSSSTSSNTPSRSRPFVVPKHSTVAIAIGSRNISQVSNIVKQCVAMLKEHDLKPFIVPAMGSHGGGTVEGEISVLEGLGITEASVGAPVNANQSIVEIGQLGPGLPAMMAQVAWDADFLVVINRIKPHTKFNASIESGLTKMMTVGLGKQKGAALYHQAAVEYSFNILQQTAKLILERGKVLFGLAVLEDGYKNLAQIHVVQPNKWFQTEAKLLEQARKMMPRIPFENLDILIVDEIGKDISGIGMDSNVTGRHRDIVGDFNIQPKPKRIFVRNLSPGTHGNGSGIGLADFTTNRLVNALDLKRTYTNALTAISPEKAALPIHFETDRECIEACLQTIGPVPSQKARIVRIRNTATVDIMEVSRAFEEQICNSRHVEILSPWRPFAFNKASNLLEDLTTT